MGSRTRVRSAALLTVGVLFGTLLLTPAGAHVGGTASHLWKRHIVTFARKTFFTKKLSDKRYLPMAMRPGQTVRGTMGSSEHVLAGLELSANASLPIPAPVGLYESTVTMDEGADDGADTCTGTFRQPTAPPGYACIYPYSTDNVDLTTMNGTVWGLDDIRFGFQASWFSTSDGMSALYATWAYTAPL